MVCFCFAARWVLQALSPGPLTSIASINPHRRLIEWLHIEHWLYIKHCVTCVRDSKVTNVSTFAPGVYNLKEGFSGRFIDERQTMIISLSERKVKDKVVCVVGVLGAGWWWSGQLAWKRWPWADLKVNRVIIVDARLKEDEVDFNWACGISQQGSVTAALILNVLLGKWHCDLKALRQTNATPTQFPDALGMVPSSYENNQTINVKWGNQESSAELMNLCLSRIQW